MKKTKAISVILSLTMLCCAGSSAWAHPGRLDKNGGHYDRSNGTYHYHTGGSSSGSKSSAKSTDQSGFKSYAKSTGKAQAPVAAAQPDYLVLSSIKTFINGCELPTFSHSSHGGAYIIAEDLKDYGFDTYWNGESKTLTIIKSAEKAMNPLPMDYYKSFGTGYKFFKVNENNLIQIVFKNSADEGGYQPSCLSCGGYMAVSIDELKAFTDQWSWDGATNSLSLNLQ